MELSRHYYIAEGLDDLDEIETKLESAGVPPAQVHVLSRDNAGVTHREHLHGVPSFMKRDLVHSAIVGAVVGAVLAVASLLIAYMAGWTDSAAGWIPFIFLAAILLGFCTWFGGMHGLRVPNYHFERFQETLDEGKHVLFVDIDHSLEAALEEVIAGYPDVKPAGTGESMQSWLVEFENRTGKWWYWRMWRDV